MAGNYCDIREDKLSFIISTIMHCYKNSDTSVFYHSHQRPKITLSRKEKTRRYKEKKKEEISDVKLSRLNS